MGDGAGLGVERRRSQVAVWGHDPTRVREINQTRMNARYLPKWICRTRSSSRRNSKKQLSRLNLLSWRRPQKRCGRRRQS